MRFLFIALSLFGCMGNTNSKSNSVPQKSNFELGKLTKFKQNVIINDTFWFKSKKWHIEQSDSQTFAFYGNYIIQADTTNLPTSLFYNGHKLLYPLLEYEGADFGQKAIGWQLNNQVLLIQYENPSYSNYYAFQPKLNKIDTLNGAPIFYKNRVISLMEPNTDQPRLITLWKISDSGIEKIWEVDLKNTIGNLHPIQATYESDKSVHFKAWNFEPLGERYFKITLMVN